MGFCLWHKNVWSLSSSSLRASKTFGFPISMRGASCVTPKLSLLQLSLYAKVTYCQALSQLQDWDQLSKKPTICSEFEFLATSVDFWKRKLTNSQGLHQSWVHTVISIEALTTRLSRMRHSNSMAAKAPAHGNSMDLALSISSSGCSCDIHEVL